MDIRQLRYLVQIVDSGSISKAADILRVAQPSLSLQLKALEDKLGVKLVARHPRGIAPTPDGKILVEHARKVLRELDQIREVLTSTPSNPSGRVRVGLPTSACRGLSVPLIDAAASRYPGITLHIIEAMSGYLDEWIESGKLDIALLYNQKAFENVAWTEMMVEDLMLITASGSDLAARDHVTFTELTRLKLVIPGQPNTVRLVLEHLAAKLDLEFKAVLDCDSLQAIIELVKSGYATVMPQFAVNHAIATGDLCAVPLVNPTPSWRLSVVLSKRTANTHGSAAIAQLLAETISTMVERKAWKAELKL